MRIHYSHQADALYIRLKEADIMNTDEITEDIIMDFDKDGNVVGIEILSASEKADMKQLIIQAFDKVMVEQSSAT
jgi:uncharacterized protein YuzE